MSTPSPLPSPLPSPSPFLSPFPSPEPFPSSSSIAPPTPSPSSTLSLSPLSPLPSNGILLCDWIRSAANCRDEDWIRAMLIASSALHLFTAFFGLWLLVYRNKGFNRKIFSELYVKSGSGLRPKPMDCIVFFTAWASIVKVAANIPLILDVFQDKLWARIAIEQTYWVLVAIGFSSYFVGLLNAMPITTRQGIFAVYQPETAFDARPLPQIHVLTPSTIQKNLLLVLGAVYPTVLGAGVGVASAFYAQTPGQERLSQILLLVQYSNWVLILWSMAIMFLYYGIKYTFILRANIVIAEAALKAPKAAFGIGNLRSSSPARFLFIQLQITGFGGAAVTTLAGLLCLLWVLFRPRILAMDDDRLPHTMAFFWTCAMAVCFFVFMILIAIQSVRNRSRGLHDSTSGTNSFLPSSAQKPSSSNKDPYSSRTHQHSSSFPQRARSDSEARLAQHSFSDISTLHSNTSIEKEDQVSLNFADTRAFEGTVAAMVEAARRMDHDAFNVEHHCNRMENDRNKKTPLASPSRPLSIKPPRAGPESFTAAGQDQGRRGSDAMPDLRHTVFGKGPRPTSPSLSPPNQIPTLSSAFFPHTIQPALLNSIPLEPMTMPRSSESYSTSAKGLQPPPRNNSRMPTSESRSRDRPLFQSETSTTTVPRDTFMRTPPISEYSDSPRVGGGVRRKSLKGTEESSREPSWPMPPCQN